MSTVNLPCGCVWSVDEQEVTAVTVNCLEMGNDHKTELGSSTLVITFTDTDELGLYKQHKIKFKDEWYTWYPSEQGIVIKGHEIGRWIVFPWWNIRSYENVPPLKSRNS
jgi:hypothetical protein